MSVSFLVIPFAKSWIFRLPFQITRENGKAVLEISLYHVGYPFQARLHYSVDRE